MADLTGLFQVRRYTLGAGIGTIMAVVSPIDCGQIVIQNTDATNAIQVRSDASNPDSEKSVPAGQELTLRLNTTTPGFTKGTPILWMFGNAGTPVACVSFLR